MCLLGRSFKLVAYKQILNFRAWVARAISILTSKIRPNYWQLKDEEAFSDRLSGLATRNLFSWTFFADGIRTEEKPLWKHEWLEMLLEWDLGADASESSSSEMTDEAKYRSLEYIKRWQEDVSLHAISDCECQSKQ